MRMTHCDFSGARNSTALAMWFGVFAACVVVACSRSSYAEKLEAEAIFAPNRLVEVEIKLDPADWQRLRRQSRSISSAFNDATAKPFDYFQGDVSIDGVEIGSVGVRKKGFIGSLDETRPSLKINFDKFVDQDPARGFGQLTLNNNKQDTSLVSQFLTYRLFRAAGIAAPRCNHACVTVNGEYLGIYSNVEAIKKSFLKRQFGDSSGTLYEGTLADFYPRGVERLEAKTDADDLDRAQARKLAELLNGEGDLPLDKLDELVDVEHFMKFWVMECLLGFWDGYSANQNNFFTYIKPENEKFYFIPWGADSCFTERSPLNPFGGGPISVKAKGSLANRLYHTKGVAARFRTVMLELLEGVWKEEALLAEIARVEALVAGRLHERQQNAPEAMDKIRDFLGTRRERLTKEFDRWPVAVQAKPRKPFYAVDIGSVKGTFDAVWSAAAVSNPQEVGAAEIALQLGDEKVVLKQLGVMAHPEKAAERRSDAAADDGESPTDERQNVNLVFTGTRQKDDVKVTLALTMKHQEYSAQPSVPVGGTLTIGRSRGGFMGLGGRQARGEIQLAEAGKKPGDRVAGSLELRIFELRGGIFAGGGPLKKPADAKAEKRSMLQKRALSLFRAHDANADGRLDAEEWKKIKQDISGADADGNGGVSLTELVAWLEKQD